MSRSGAVVAVAVLLAVSGAAAPDLKPILVPYLEIQRALHADSIGGLKEAAGRVVSAAAALGAAAEPMRASAADLQHAPDLSAARAAFGTLSEGIIAYAKQAGATLPDGVKVAYCPMARKHWLQEGDDIRNPFYGHHMSDCGRFVTSGQ